MKNLSRSHTLRKTQVTKLSLYCCCIAAFSSMLAENKNLWIVKEGASKHCTIFCLSVSIHLNFCFVFPQDEEEQQEKPKKAEKEPEKKDAKKEETKPATKPKEEEPKDGKEKESKEETTDKTEAKTSEEEDASKSSINLAGQNVDKLTKQLFDKGRGKYVCKVCKIMCTKESVS